MTLFGTYFNAMQILFIAQSAKGANVVQGKET